MAVRIALATRLSPGRDELAYWYWAWHAPDASYSWVTVNAVRASTAILGDGALAMRLPGMLAAIAAAGLVMRLARRAGATERAATWAATAFVAAPWQNWVGSVVHPDAFFTLFVLWLVDRAAAAGRGEGRLALPGAAAAAGLAALTKLTGAILLVVPVAMAWRRRRTDPAGAVAAVAVAAGMGATLLAARDPGVVAGLREFGRFAPGVAWTAAAALVLGGVVLLGGPALLLGAARGAPAALRGRAGPAAAVAGILLAFHLAFMFLGQAKANWFLPAAALLLPAGATAAPRRGRRGALLGSFAISLVAGVLLLGVPAGGGGNGGPAAPGRGLLSRLDAAYALQIGSREATVSPSRRWSDRLAEYAPSPLPARPPGDGPPPRILSRDYGLAFAVARRWGRDAEVLLPGDPVYRHSCGRPPVPGEDFVFVSRMRARPPAPFGGRFETIRERPHPNDPGLTVLDCLGWTPPGGKEPR